MTDEEFAKGVKKAVQNCAKRSAEEHIQDLINAGIIDEKGRVFSENLGMVQALLRKKGFDLVSAFHIGNVPSGAVRLHEKVADGRQAEGPYPKMRSFIKKARSQEGLWQALQAAGYLMRPAVTGKKKTG